MLFAVARLAGIQAAKRTADWVPLAHTLPLEHVELEVEPVAGGVRGLEPGGGDRPHRRRDGGARRLARPRRSRFYDMVKAVERSAVITDLRLEGKLGGASGDFRRG